MMITTPARRTARLISALLAASLVGPAIAKDKPFSLARAIPDDVFIFNAERHNPEREFIDRYWGEVFSALKETGIGDDLMGLIGSLLGEGSMAEFERLKERATDLVEGVNWEQLGEGEMVFAERLAPPIRVGDGGMMMPPNLVFIIRG